jgi:MFS family permease
MSFLKRSPGRAGNKRSPAGGRGATPRADAQEEAHAVSMLLAGPGAPGPTRASPQMIERASARQAWRRAAREVLGEVRTRQRADVWLTPLSTQAVNSAFVVLGLDAVAASLGMPILAFYVKELGGTASTVGALLATYAGSNVAASFWVGAASDTFGRRRMMLVSVIGVAMGFLGCGLAPSLSWLFLARGWVGFWSGVGSVGRAYIADVTDEAERTTMMGRAMGINLVGYSVGAPVGSLLSMLPGGYRTPYFVAAAAALGLFPFIAMRLPQTGAIRAELDRRDMWPVGQQQGAEDVQVPHRNTSPAPASALPPSSVENDGSFLRRNKRASRGSVDVIDAEAGATACASPSAHQESPSSSPRAAEDRRTIAGFCSRIEAHLKPGAAPILYLLCACASLGAPPPQAFFLAVWPLYINGVFGWGAQAFSLFIVGYTVSAALTQFLLLKGAVARFGRMPLAASANLITSIGFLVLWASASGASATSSTDGAGGGSGSNLLQLILTFCGFGLCVSVAGFTSGVVAPSVSTLGDSSVQGSLMGLVSALEVGGRMSSQLLVSSLYDISPRCAMLLPLASSLLAAAASARVHVLEKQTDETGAYRFTPL